MQTQKDLSKSRALAAKVIYTTFQLLKDAGGQLPVQTIVEEIPKKLKLNDWELGTYKKTGNVRWESILYFFSIDCVKTGFLIKQKGVWLLTKEGEAAIDLGERGLVEEIAKGYKEWVLKNKSLRSPEIGIDEDQNTAAVEKAPEITLEKVELLASTGIKEHIYNLNPYELQELVAALFRGMDYHTPFISPRGKDGGIDITAYRDPLGTMSPRIKVQVKHRPDTSSSAEQIRQLMGLLQKSEDVGIFVSTGGFTNDARLTARNSAVHVELIDLDKFIDLWQQFYPKLSDNDKALLPLKSVYFLAPAE